MFPHGGSANELTRWATAVSLVENFSFEITWSENLIGKNVDTARVGDKIYSNKPPGIAILAAPIYSLTKVFIGAPNASNIRISWFMMRFFLSSLPLLLLGFWLYGRDSDEHSLAVLLFATPLFIYSLLFFSHVLVGVLLYFAFRLIYDTERIFLRNCFFAGLLCGLAVICEFPALICVVIFGIGLLFSNRRERNHRQNLTFFILGGLPFAIILLLYNYAVFGSPFALSYAYETFPEWAEVAGSGIFGIGLPTLSNAYLLLFSPARGLLFYSPILILSFIALFSSRERNTLRHRVKFAAILFSIIALCGHGAAHGGWAFGARYLVFIVPLLLDSFFDGEIYEYSNLWQGFLFGVSFLLCTIPALTFLFAPPEFKYPHNNFWFTFLWQENWFTPNLANVFGFSSSIWTILPVILLLFVVLLIAWRSARKPHRFFIGLISAVILTAIYLVLPTLDNAENEFRRATIAERYFKPANRLDRFKSDNAFAPRVSNFEFIIAETRAFAPNDFPYLETREVTESPTVRLKKAAELQKQGNIAEAENLLQKGKEDFPFVRCEFSTNLAVIYYTTNRKNEALNELESVQNLVTTTSRPDCLRSQFLLGSLYRENSQTEQANQIFQKFISNTQNSNDAEIKKFRQELGVK